MGVGGVESLWDTLRMMMCESWSGERDLYIYPGCVSWDWIWK